MSNRFYKLVGKKVVSISFEDFCKYLKEEEDEEFPIIELDGVIGYATICTVFLGMDHSFLGKLPLLFETTIIKNPNGGIDEEEIEVFGRTSNYNDAVEMHKKAMRECMIKTHFWHKLKYKINKYLNSK